MSSEKSRTDAQTLMQLIIDRQVVLNLTDEEIAEAMGYEKVAIVTMIKAGTMRVPVNKAAALARVLQVEGFDVLSRLLKDQSPELWGAIENLLPAGKLSATELSLIKHVRSLVGNRQSAPIVMSGAGVIALVAV